MSPVRLAMSKLGESSHDIPTETGAYNVSQSEDIHSKSFRQRHCPACNKVLSCKCPEDRGRVSFTCWFHCRAQGLIYNAFSVGEASDLWLVWAEKDAGMERIPLFTHLPWLPCEHVWGCGLKGCFLISGNLGVVETWEGPSFYFIFIFWLVNLSWMMFLLIYHSGLCVCFNLFVLCRREVKTYHHHFINEKDSEIIHKWLSFTNLECERASSQILVFSILNILFFLPELVSLFKYNFLTIMDILRNYIRLLIPFKKKSLVFSKFPGAFFPYGYAF